MDNLNNPEKVKEINDTLIRGNFEIHLITKPEKQMQLFGCIEDIKAMNDPKIIRPRATSAYALYGKHPNQPMITFWVHGSEKEACSTATQVTKYLEDRNVPIIRMKVEAMAHNDNVPNEVVGQHYFEYHFKIQGLTGRQDWNKLVDLTVPHGVHLFHNPFNKNLVPILTLRSYVSLSDLEKRYQKLVEVLNLETIFTLDYHVEKEYSVIDTNERLDEDWLFKGDPYNFIVKVEPYMKF